MNYLGSLQAVIASFLPNLPHYSFSLFISMVLLSESGSATSRNTGLQIAPKIEPVSQEAIRVAGKKVYIDRFTESTARNFFTTSLQLQIAQSPATKPQNPNQIPPEIAQLLAKANQLQAQALLLQVQPKPQDKRLAIAKYEELLKIWRLPKIREMIPKESRIFEANVFNSIGNIYSSLSENAKAANYIEQALAIFSALKEPEVRYGEASAFYTIGLVYTNLGEKQKALNAFTQAHSIFQADNKPGLAADALYGIASVYSLFGEPKRMFEPLNEAWKIHKANPNLQQANTSTGSIIGAIAEAYQISGETDQALKYYQQALQIHSQAQDLSGQAGTLSSIALVYSSRNEHKQAEAYSQKALQLQQTILKQLQKIPPPKTSATSYLENTDPQQIKQQIQVALARLQYFNNQSIILNSIATNYNLIGDYGQQIKYLNQALSFTREGGLTQSEADVLSSIGEAYSYIGETQKARDFINQALKIQRDISYPKGEVETLKRIAFIDKNSGKFQQALDNLNKSLVIVKQQQNPYLEGQILSDIALVYKDLGAYDLSIDNYKKALAIFQQKFPLLTGSTLYLTGNAYWQRGKSQETPEDYDQALKSFQQAINYSRQQGSVLLEASILSTIARTNESLRDYPQAIANAKQSLELSRKYNIKGSENTALNVLSIVYEAAGDYQKALDANKQSLSLSDQLGDLSGIASAYQNRGKIYTSMKQPQQAIEAYTQELKLGQQIGNISHQTIALRQIARIERDRGNLNQAKTHIETAIKIIEDTRTKIDRNDLRTSYFATVQDYYKFYIDLLMQLHKKDPSKGYAAEALHISERSRARALVELLTEARVDIRKGVDPKLLEEEQRLLQLIDAKGKLLQELPADKPERQAVLRSEINSLYNQYTELQTKIRQSNPEYGKLKYPNPEDILKLPQIQQQLDKDTLLLQYSIGEERSYLWAVTPNSLNTYELPGRKQIAQAAEKYKRPLLHCQKPNVDCQDLSPSQKAEFFQAATQLSQIILAPVAGKLDDKRLVIVGDGALQDIPFAALVAPNTSATNQKDYQPLILKHEIVNLPSMTAIATHRQKLRQRQLAPKTLAVLANPVFSATDTRVTGKPEGVGGVPDSDFSSQLEQSALKQVARNLQQDGLWPALPGTETEAEAILSLVPSASKLSALNFDATYNWATNKQLTQYRYIHFATHGFADSTNPELSGIVLSLVNQQGKPIRGYLRLGDIFNLNLPAELVVLSACETGLGKDVKNEGLVGLTRGLMYAGSASVALSLWQVSDSATVDLMKEFYRQILQGNKSPNAALRAAQIAMWQNKDKDWRYPYYWAAFTIQGEWR